MPSSSSRVVRYARAWLGGPAALSEAEIQIDRGDATSPATVLRPVRQARRLPTWVVLHGITVAGRSHEQLSRFARTLASSGAVVVLPEVAEWRALRLVPALAAPTVRASIDGVRRLGWADDAPVGVVGFSFGAPHAIACSGHADLAGDVAATVGFGGYCDLDDTLAHMMGVGSATSPSRSRPELPDPYGRWIIAANFLEHVDVPGGDEVGSAIRRLVTYAGSLASPDWETECSPLRDRLRSELAPSRRRLFDIVAPPVGSLPPSEEARALATALSAAARRIEPAIDPRDALGGARAPVHILHGRSDRLIPCTEAPKIRAALPPETPARLTITRLFGHSEQDSVTVRAMLRDMPRFVAALRAILAAV